MTRFAFIQYSILKPAQQADANSSSCHRFATITNVFKLSLHNLTDREFRLNFLDIIVTPAAMMNVAFERRKKSMSVNDKKTLTRL